MTSTFRARKLALGFARLFAGALLLVAITVSGAVPARAGRPGGSPPFCAPAERLEQEFRDARGFAIRERAEVRSLARAVRTASADAPRSLRSSFRTLLRFYDRILSGDIEVEGDDQAEKDRYGEASERAGRASLVLARYLRDRCGILL